MPSYDDMARTVLSYYTQPGSLDKYGGWQTIFNPGNEYQVEAAYKAIEANPDVVVLKHMDGSVAGWWSKSSGSSNILPDVGSLPNSNVAGGTAQSTAISNIQTSPTITEVSPGHFKVANEVATKGGRWVTNGGVGGAVMVTAAGLSAGITIDKAIYKYNPFMFSDERLEKYNPEKWKQISSAVDEQWTEMGYPVIGNLGRMVCDVILGVDSTDNSTQMYINEDAYTYALAYLQSLGTFDFSSYAEQGSMPDSYLHYPGLYSKVYYVTDKMHYSENSSAEFIDVDLSEAVAKGGTDVKGVLWTQYPSGVERPFVSGSVYTRTKLNSKLTFKYTRIDTGEVVIYKANGPYTTTLKNGDVIYEYQVRSGPIYLKDSTVPSIVYPTRDASSLSISYCSEDIINLLYLGTSFSSSNVPGVGSQSGALLPSLSTATDFDSFKTLLKQQYPDVWTNSVARDVLQPDGTLKTFTYVPVPTPNATDWMDTQPTGNGSQQSQKDTVVKPGMDTSIKDTISSSGSTGTTTPNPPDTGGGNSPTVVPPVGNASSLWSIYNPTLEQVNQFGSWLWSSNFVEQLKKLFSDPMQAIIGLHKVYSPVQTSGQGTIKCGYLDSAVPSKLVSEQYVTVDCGSVDLQEYFGNVFDYPPYTEVSIYLPFIGIRQLDTSDVMRSTISVIYHVDVLTGACLAEVNVKRDAAGGSLYTFSGDAAVRYPVSSGSYMGIVSGLIGVATSVVSGNLLPALGGATRLHTNVDRSGSFTGNAGVMGSKIPYLIISRPQTAMADNFETLSGYPSNTYTPLSACTGYTQVRYVHVENLTATDAEKQEIERLLKEGVIL